ncbi:hypothetical protein BHE74_00054179 [Ensete ventricosum]|nr:hypothetical protein BHE74_00054179 [Ensete ventricosum]
MSSIRVSKASNLAPVRSTDAMALLLVLRFEGVVEAGKDFGGSGLRLGRKYFEEYGQHEINKDISNINDIKYGSKMAVKSDAADAAAEFYVEEQQFDKKFSVVRQRLKEEFEENLLVRKAKPT